MFFRLKYHKILLAIYLLTILANCQLQEPFKNHGIIFLENRSKKLVLNKSNKNDVINIVGQPHSKSINNENEWFYIERVLTKGKYHKLGKESPIQFIDTGKKIIMHVLPEAFPVFQEVFPEKCRRSFSKKQQAFQKEVDAATGLTSFSELTHKNSKKLYKKQRKLDNKKKRKLDNKKKRKLDNNKRERK